MLLLSLSVSYIRQQIRNILTAIINRKSFNILEKISFLNISTMITDNNKFLFDMLYYLDKGSKPSAVYPSISAGFMISCSSSSAVINSNVLSSLSSLNRILAAFPFIINVKFYVLIMC